MLQLITDPVQTMRRVVFAGVLVAFGLSVAVLSLSDRAPRAAFWRSRMVVRSLESRAGFDLVSWSDVPFESDSVGHFAIWGVAGVLAWFALGRRVTAILLIAALISVSAGVEFAQPLLSHSREASYDDLVANALGISIGVASAWLVSLVHRRARRLA